MKQINFSLSLSIQTWKKRIFKVSFPSSFKATSAYSNKGKKGFLFIEMGNPCIYPHWIKVTEHLIYLSRTCPPRWISPPFRPWRKPVGRIQNVEAAVQKERKHFSTQQTPFCLIGLLIIRRRKKFSFVNSIIHFFLFFLCRQLPSLT